LRIAGAVEKRSLSLRAQRSNLMISCSNHEITSSLSLLVMTFYPLFGQLLLPFLLCAVSCKNSVNSDTMTITVEEVHSILERKEDVLLLDVRTPQEFSGELGHLPDALLIPVQELEARYQELEPHKDKEMVVYCRSGNRSGRAVDFLSQKGFKAKNMLGGMLAWRERFGNPK